MYPLLLSLAIGLCHGSVFLLDPSDAQSLPADAADSSLLAVYDITPVMYQTIAVEGPYYYAAADAVIAHETLSVDANDTSVVVITDASTVNISHSTVVKHGYSSNLYEASFFGINAAVNVANGSTLHVDHTNITTHNGAANIYSYGDDSVVYVDHASLYSSGPVSHGLYAAGNGTIVAHHVHHYSRGNRASSFSGDSPAGYVYVYDSRAHTAGIGSAIFYALGTVLASNVVGRADRSPVLLSDGPQTASFVDSDMTAGLLAGAVIFSSSEREAGASLTLDNTVLTVLPDTAPALWFGNIIASAYVTNSQLNTTSGILVVANYSQVTQDFDYYAGYSDNSAMSPAEATVVVSSSVLTGDLVAYNASSVAWSLADYSAWTGTAYSGYRDAYFSVALDATSNWTVTNDTYLTNFTDADTTLANVYSFGHTVYYDPSSSANSWLANQTLSLTGGGSVKPGTNWR